MIHSLNSFRLRNENLCDAAFRSLGPHNTLRNSVISWMKRRWMTQSEGIPGSAENRLNHSLFFRRWETRESALRLGEIHRVKRARKQILTNSTRENEMREAWETGKPPKVLSKLIYRKLTPPIILRSFSHAPSIYRYAMRPREISMHKLKHRLRRCVGLVRASFFFSFSSLSYPDFDHTSIRLFSKLTATSPDTFWFLFCVFYKKRHSYSENIPTWTDVS